MLMAPHRTAVLPGHSPECHEYLNTFIGDYLPNWLKKVKLKRGKKKVLKIQTN